MDLARQHFCLQRAEVSIVGSQGLYCRLAGQEQSVDPVTYRLPSFSQYPCHPGQNSSEQLFEGHNFGSG